MTKKKETCPRCHGSRYIKYAGIGMFAHTGRSYRCSYCNGKGYIIKEGE